MNGLDGRNVSIVLVKITYKKIQYVRGDDVMEEAGKAARVLSIYNRLILGELINKANEAEQFGVNEKSIQRDIDEIRTYLSQSTVDGYGIMGEVVYDRIEKGYRLEQIDNKKFTNSELLAICKILLDGRAFTKEQMNSMIDRLIECCVPKQNREIVKSLLANEQYHYIEPHHKTDFLDTMWQIGEAISKQKYIEIDYQGIQGSSVKTRKIKPLAIMFSDYYFYMAAFIEDKKVRENFNVLNDAFPTIYRIDRIRRMKVLDENYKVIYKDRFEEGEFRKRIQFMFGGKLRKVRFEYSGYSVEAVLDRLPTAKIEKEENGVYTISAEVFGDGIDMWLRSQGDRIRVLWEDEVGKTVPIRKWK